MRSSRLSRAISASSSASLLAAGSFSSKLANPASMLALALLRT